MRYSCAIRVTNARTTNEENECPPKNIIYLGPISHDNDFHNTFFLKVNEVHLS